MMRTGVSGRRRALVSLLVGAACLTSSCSLFNPHVSPSLPAQTYRQPTPYELQKMSPAEKKAIEEGPKFAGGVGHAIDHVNAWRQAYYDAVGEQSMMKNGVAMAVIPAAAVAGYFGITGGSRDVIAGLATGAAGVLGLGIFFESENRQQIYLSGYRSMGCLLFAAAPMLMPQGQYEALQNDVQGLDDDLARLDQAIANARAATEILNQPANALTVQADIQIAGAKQLMLKAEEAQAAGLGIQSRIRQAELIIETAAGDIAAEVSSQIVDDESRLSALTEITGGIPGTAERIARIPPAKEKAAPEAAAEGQAFSELSEKEQALADALGELEKAVDDVTLKSRRLQLTVNQYADITQSLQNIKGCGFETVDLGLKIQPNETSVEIETGKSKSILISGGKRPYSAALTGQVPEGVTLTRSGFDQQPVVAVVTAGTSTGEFDLAITDGAGSGNVLIHFKVIPAATTETAGGDPGGGNRGGGNSGGGNSGGGNSGGGNSGGGNSGGGIPASEAALNEEAQRNIKEFRVAQYAVGLRGDAVDGDIRGTSRDKIREFQAGHGLAATGVIDDALYNELVKIVEADWPNARPLLGCELEDTLTVFECTKLSKSMVSLMQQKLPVPETGILDPATRQKIREATEAETDRPPNREALSQSLFSGITARPTP